MKTNNQRKPYIKPVCEHFFYPMESHLLSNSGYKRKSLWDD